MKNRGRTSKLDFDAIYSEILNGLAEIAPEGETFIGMMEGPYRGLGWLLSEVEDSQKQWNAGNAQAALIAAWCAIVRLSRERAILAAAASTMKARIAEPVTLKEIKRCAGKRNNDVIRRCSSDKKRNEARTLFAEYTKADIKKRGLKSIYVEMGEIIQQRLKLPTPIKGDTVRKYLK